ncbi:MAG TPA: hypothetical protein VJ691_00640 [Vicinamibacterales bacterium]|nr:hypothetical protein [Vicinamibacterales bacterium]
MKFVAVALLALQFAQRPPLAPAETLLEPELLRTIERASVEGKAPRVIAGTDKAAGEIVLACAAECEAVEWAMTRLATSGVPAPSRTIRVITVQQPPADTRAAIFAGASSGSALQVIRGLWSTAGIVDEVVEVFARHAVGAVNTRAYERIGQPRWEARGIPVTTIVPPADATGLDRASFIMAASAYCLATLPNSGAEALLSHLTVGAHSRLAEDGRRAIALMGPQQRASGDVLVLLGQAIEREQRRMRSFERFMPTPVDPMLRSRIADMEKGITSVWTSLGVTSSPFVPAAERLRGRAGEDRRVPARLPPATPLAAELPPALAKHPNAELIAYELNNFIDGARSISDIRDAVFAEFGSVALPAVVEYFERLAKAGEVTLR